MQVRLFNVNIVNKNNLTSAPKQKFGTASPLAPLAKDTISFGAMKKPQFDGIDYMVVERFKPPIEKFNSNDDFQAWCAEKIKSDYLDKDFSGRKKETRIQRKAMLKEWSDYVLKENDAYNNAMALLILTAITKDLKPKNDNIPPVLNKGVLADCISEIDRNLKTDKNYHADLNKMYQNKLRALYLEDTKTGETETKWIIIPSKKHDPENFEKNVEKLKTLSHKNWCTKSFNAKPYLEKGDFHAYLENGQPKLGVRFVKNKIEEIQGEKNNRKIPVTYLDIAKNHINEHELNLSDKTEKEIHSAEKVKAEVEKIKSDLTDAIKAKDTVKIFNYLGYGCTQDDDGKLILEKYNQPSGLYTFADCGIDENWLLEKVKEIKGDADFENSNAKELNNLEAIGGDAIFRKSKIKNLPMLKSIGGDAMFNYSEIELIPNLEIIGGSASYAYSNIKDLGGLEEIGGDAIFESSEIKDLGNLEMIGGNAFFNASKVKTLGKLKYINGDAYFDYSVLETLSNLEEIGGDAIFESSEIKDLGNLEKIGGDAYFADSTVKTLGKLKSIGGKVVFSLSEVESLSNLETIGGDAIFDNSVVKDLGNLKYVGGRVECYDCLLSENDKRKLRELAKH